MAGWRHMLWLVAFPAALAGLLLCSTAAFADAAANAANDPNGAGPVPTPPCISPLPQMPSDFKGAFDVRDVILSPVPAGTNLRKADYYACVVTNNVNVRDITVFAMLLDRQGHYIAQTEGPSKVNPQPTIHWPGKIKLIIVPAKGRTLTSVTEEQWQNRSDKVIVVVQWKDESGVLRQETFYVPYTSAPNAQGN